MSRIFVAAAVFAGQCLAASSPRSLKWTDQPVGPDGPWNALIVPVDNSPRQNLTLLPSLTETSLFVAESACSNQTSVCPNPSASLFSTFSDDHKAYLWMDGPHFDAQSYDKTVRGPLRLQGSAYRMHEKVTLLEADDVDAHDLFDQAAMTTEDFTVHYPGNAKYTMATGFFSLMGDVRFVNWTNASGSAVSQETHLQNAAYANLTQSISYGLHVGSVNLEVPPSLVVGGYDRSRCLSEPITSDNQTFKLLDIGIGVEEGAWAWERQINLSSGTNTTSFTGLLSEPAGISVMPNPGVPYLYLPQATCDAITENLPVVFDSNLGLYLWNTTGETSWYDEQTKEFVASPHYLSFTLQGSSSTENTTIKVPFALLNLTLDDPIVTKPTSYFPCSPYTPTDGTYHLGRSFLQAALLAQKWTPTDTTKSWSDNTTSLLWLAQAPGPDIPSAQVVTIGASDTQISMMPNAPTWYNTWSKTLKPLYTSVPQPIKSNNGLSTGAIVGLVIGIIVAVAILAAALFIIRRKRRRAQAIPQHENTESQQYTDDGSQQSPLEMKNTGVSEAGSTPLYEIDAIGEKGRSTELPGNEGKMTAAYEVDGRGHVAELPAQDVVRG